MPTPTQGVRSHAVVPHTADAGIRAQAPDLPGLFEEAAAALAGLAADVAPDVRPSVSVPIELDASDLAGLAFAWLNELIGLGDAGRAALVATTVEQVDQTSLVVPAAEAGPALVGGWTLRGRAWFASSATDRIQPRIGVKAATFHGLTVAESSAGWSLSAYLDV